MIRKELKDYFDQLEADIKPVDEFSVGERIREILNVKEKKITEKELQKAKDYLKGITSLALDASDSRASFYAIQELLENKILTPDEKFKEIDKVSINDINNIAKDIFVPEKLNLAVIGPAEEKDSHKLKQLLRI